MLAGQARTNADAWNPALLWLVSIAVQQRRAAGFPRSLEHFECRDCREACCNWRGAQLLWKFCWSAESLGGGKGKCRLLSDRAFTGYASIHTALNCDFERLEFVQVGDNLKEKWRVSRQLFWSSIPGPNLDFRTWRSQAEGTETFQQNLRARRDSQKIYNSCWSIHACIHAYMHTLHYIALHCIALHCITLHYITLHTYLPTYLRRYIDT